MPDAWGRRLWSRRIRMAAVAGSEGAHRLARVGPGIDLAGIRPFEPGDDPRKLDAGASARRGFPQVRDDRPSPSQTLHFVIEGRARLGSSPGGAALEAIRGVVAMLAPVALGCGDPVALTLMERGGMRHWPASRDPAMAEICLAQLESNPGSAGPPSGEWPALISRGSLAFVITDGLSKTLPQQLAILSRRAETRLLLVRHPWVESDVPAGPLVDPETGSLTPPPSRQGWLAWLEGVRSRMKLHREACPRHAELSSGAGEATGLLLGSLLAGPP